MSRESNQPVRPGRCLRLKVNLPIFKDKKHQRCCNLPLVVMKHRHFPTTPVRTTNIFLPYVFQSLQHFLGDLARSPGKDTTLNDNLQILDKHYGVVMMFNTLRKELYCLKQGSGENMAEFRVHLSQQVHILQSEY